METGYHHIGGGWLEEFEQKTYALQIRSFLPFFGVRIRGKNTPKTWKNLYQDRFVLQVISIGGHYCTSKQKTSHV